MFSFPDDVFQMTVAIHRLTWPVFSWPEILAPYELQHIMKVALNQ